MPVEISATDAVGQNPMPTDFCWQAESIFIHGLARLSPTYDHLRYARLLSEWLAKATFLWRALWRISNPPPLGEEVIKMNHADKVSTRPLGNRTLTFSRRGCFCPSHPRAMWPARSTTFRCRDTAGRLIAKRAAISRTLRSPRVANRLRMASRSRSPGAANVSLEAT